MEFNEKRLTATEVISKIATYGDKDFVLSMDRDKNEDTINKYKLTSEDIIYYIRHLTVNNKPHCIENKDKRYKTKYLYEFKKNPIITIEDEYGDFVSVSMFFKVGFHSNKSIIYGVSFHEDDFIK